MKLEIKNLSKTISGLKVLDNINLEFSEGLHILMGAGGSGKTSMIKILSGNLSPDDGKILIDGQEVRAKQLIDIIAFSPDGFGAYNNFTVLKTLEYIALLKGLNRKIVDNEVKSVLEITELSRFVNTKIKNLSQGLKVKLAIAQALLNNPKIILLDEPTRSLDIDERIIISDLIQKIIQDRIVIVSNHIAADFANLPANIIFIKNGKLIFKGFQQDLIQEYKSAKLGEEQEKEFAKIYMRTLGFYHLQNNNKTEIETQTIENIVPKNSHLQNYGDFSFDKKSYTAKYKNQAIDLTPVEFLILLNLLQNYDTPLSAEELFIFACGGQFYKGAERAIAVHIARIRKKLSKLDKALGSSLKNIRNHGYLFEL